MIYYPLPKILNVITHQVTMKFAHMNGHWKVYDWKLSNLPYIFEYFVFSKIQYLQ